MQRQKEEEPLGSIEGYGVKKQKQDFCIITTLTHQIYVCPSQTVLIHLLGRENVSLHIIKTAKRRVEC